MTDGFFFFVPFPGYFTVYWKYQLSEAYNNILVLFKLLPSDIQNVADPPMGDSWLELMQSESFQVYSGVFGFSHQPSLYTLEIPSSWSQYHLSEDKFYFDLHL